MKCIMKKGLLVAGLGTAAAFALFGTNALRYGRYAAHQVRETARAAVPFEADVEAARQQVADLEPAIVQGIETLAKLDDSIMQVEGEIAALQGQMDQTGRKIQALKASLDREGIQRVSSTDPTARRVKISLGRQIDEFKRAQYILDVKQDELQHRRDRRETLVQTLTEMRDKKDAMLSKIREIEARHDAIQITETFEDVNLDTGALKQAEQAVSDLDRRVNLEQRKYDLKAQFGVDQPASISCDDEVECDRDVLREADEILGTTSAADASREL